MPTTTPFAIKRRAPVIVLQANADIPLVREGGATVNTEALREDFYQADHDGWKRAGVLAWEVGCGEPFARWA